MTTSPPMRRAVLADTGPLYALADRGDQFHLRASEELHRLTAERLHIALTYSTLAESYTLVLRRLGVTYGHRWLHDILEGTALISPEPRDYIKAIELTLSFRDQAITLFDAVAAVVGHRLTLPLWTYDRRFDLIGSERWR